VPVLTPPRALPGLLISLVQFLELRGKVPEDELFDLTVPETFRKADGEGAAQLTFRDTVEVGSRVGLLQAKGSSVSVAAGVNFVDSKHRAEQFLLDRLLGERNTGKDPFASAEGPSGDIARTLCWFLDLDPMDAPIFTGARKENAPQVRLDVLVPNADLVKKLSVADAAWNSFARWASYLGLARGVIIGRSQGILPDPYVAVRRLVNEFVGKRPAPIGVALAKLGDRLPVLGGGRLARQWHELHSPDEDRVVSPALAYALFRLHDEGIVQLSLVGDADVVWRLRFGRQQVVQGYDGRVAPQSVNFSHIALGA
jgi:hypothetical protein